MKRPFTNRYATIDARCMALCVALNGRDEYTFLHSTRVSSFSNDLARQCALSQKEMNALNLASILHDIGKVCIPDAVLLKPGKLDVADWDVMQTHPEQGEAIVQALNYDDFEEVAPTVRHHHERFDGRGYPDRLAGEAVPVAARILALADSYDAMATTRVYSRARTHQEIMDIFAQDQGHFDPYLRDLFVRLTELSEHRAP